MVRALLFTLTAAAGALSAVSADKVTVTPVQKVVELLTKLTAKIEAEGQAEAVGYDKFACFCKEQASDKLYAIEKSTEKIKKLDARIEQLEAEIEKLDKEVADGNVRIEELQKESEKELAIRADERAEYETADASITRAIKAVRAAITALQESRPDGALLQQAVSFAAASGLDVSRLQKLVAVQPVDRTKSAAGASDEDSKTNAYEYHSNEIIELLQRLMKQFKARKEKLFVEESTEKHAFEKVEQARQFEITTTTEAVAVASASSAKKSEEKNKASADRDEETTDKGSDQEFLDELTKQCEDKAKVFDQRSSTRAAELKAMAEATSLLKGAGGQKYGANKRLNLLSQRVREAPADESEADDVAVDAEVPQTEDAAEAAPQLAESEESSESEEDAAPAEEEAAPAEEAAEEENVDEAEAEDLATAFIQVQMESPKNQRVFAVIKAAAQSLKSPTLAALALKLKADHFVKVRTLIKDLIERLEAQAAAEATHKDQCDKDMKEAITQRDEEQAKMERENAAIETNKVMIKELEERITELKQKIADAKKALREATELREAEKAENETTIADATEGMEAIKSAVAVLKGFYGESFAQVASEVSIKAHDGQEPYKAPLSDREGNTVGDLATEGSATFEEEYHGKSDAATGIFGLLNVIRSDYERTIDTTTAAEELAQEEFLAYEKETNEQIATDEQEVEDSEKAKSEEQDELAQNEDDLADATKSNASALKKLALLKGECVDGAISHEERVKRREQEVESLKEALNILEEMSFLQKRK
jgi:hypothetical protein